jgi:hypothetical protein
LSTPLDADLERRRSCRWQRGAAARASGDCQAPDGSGSGPSSGPEPVMALTTYWRSSSGSRASSCSMGCARALASWVSLSQRSTPSTSGSPSGTPASMPSTVRSAEMIAAFACFSRCNDSLPSSAGARQGWRRREAMRSTAVAGPAARDRRLRSHSPSPNWFGELGRTRDRADLVVGAAHELLLRRRPHTSRQAQLAPISASATAYWPL